MTRITVSSLVVAALAAALFLVPAGAMTTTKLVGTVGPGFTITLKQGTKKVTKLKAGKYTFVIHDKSSIHNFHLIGRGVNKKTGVAFVGDMTWTVTLKAGKYTYQCDPHAASVRGSFRVKA